jgi:alginate O-acetyltransferase complex protein AlgI
LTRWRMALGKPIFGGRNTSVAAFLHLLAMPTLLTMLISGIWHGAGYTYILWGLLHGVFLCINHAWRLVRARIWTNTKVYNRRMAPIGFVLTFVSVVAAMVLFRAPTAGAALLLWKGMIGVYGVTLPQAVFARLGSAADLLASLGVRPAWTSGSVLVGATIRISLLLAIALLMPNTLQILAGFEPALGVKPGRTTPRIQRMLTWTPSPAWAVGLACMALAGILSLGELSEFLYWQF